MNSNNARQPKLVRLGYSISYTDERFTINRNYLPKKVLSLLNLSELQIQGKECYDNNWDQVFSMIYQPEVGKLKLSNLTRSTKAPLFNSQLFNNIVHVKFTNIRYLSLYTCNIVSIEAFAWIDAPKLQKLHFIQKFINSFRAITNIKTPLKELILQSKKPAGLDLRKLNRIKAKFQCLSLEMPRNSAIIVQDLGIMAKLPTYRPKFTIGVQKEHRSKQREERRNELSNAQQNDY